jgi:hypothetical protein
MARLNIFFQLNFKDTNYKYDIMLDSRLQFYDLIVKAIVNLNAKLNEIHTNSRNNINTTILSTIQVAK